MRNFKGLFLFVVGFFFVSSSSLIASELRVGLVLDLGGKDDKSFNSAALRGALQAKSELKSFVKYVEPTDHQSFEHLLRTFAKNKFDIVIAVGVSQAEALKKVATQYPDQKFALIDAEVKAPNVKSFLFQDHEGSYLVGAMAALKSQTGSVGFIGGVDIPLIRRFETGFSAGAKSINPKIKVISNFIGTTGDAWNNPAKAKELAVVQFHSGVDVIFGVAGASGLGIFDAAEENKKLAIGVDSNQNGVKPGFVLTSMVKRVDEAVLSICRDTAQGKFKAETESLNLSNKGIDYSLDEYNSKLFSPEFKKKTDQIKAEIVSGKIQVPDYYKIRKN